jgi:murein endopeptidase
MRTEEKATTFVVGLAVAAVVIGTAFAIASLTTSEPGVASSRVLPGSAGTTFVDNPGVYCETTPIGWQDSNPVGQPWHGRLIRGVQLPPEGDHFFTWDFGVKPSPGFRRWGADGTIRLLLGVLCNFRLTHPEGPRVGVADIARTFGGRFGRRFGGEGHASHQNGLDVDVLYPRVDHQELVAVRPPLIDRTLAQELVDGFVAAGAKYVFVGPRTGLTGPKRIVQQLSNHDDHMHVRFPRPLATKTPPPPPDPVAPVPPA